MKRVAAVFVALVMLAGCEVFADESPWNTVIPTDATYDFARTSPFMESPYHAVINEADFYGHPLYVAEETDPAWTITIQEGYENWDLYGDPIGRWNVTLTIKAPQNIDRSGGEDGHLAILHGDRLLELYMGWNTTNHPNPVTHTITALYGAEQSITGSGIDGGLRAANVAGIGGQVTQADLDNPYDIIPHAQALMLPEPVLTQGPVYPASGEDSFAAERYGNQWWGAHMGERFAIPYSVDLATLGLTPKAIKWAKGLQYYGGYIVDMTYDTSLGHVALGVDPSQLPTQADLEIMRALLVPVEG